MKTMFFTQTHSSESKPPALRIKKCLFFYKHIIEKYECDFFVFNEGIENLPENVNHFTKNGIQKNCINFDVTGIHEPGKRFMHPNGKWMIPITTGNHKAMVRAMVIAMKYGYNKVIHVDQDAQFLNDVIPTTFFEFNTGSGTSLSPHYKLREVSFSVINKDQFRACRDAYLNLLSYSDEYIVTNALTNENVMPTTHIFNFKGDRFGDWTLPETFPDNYDYLGQLPLNIYYKKIDGIWHKTFITDELEKIWL